MDDYEIDRRAEQTADGIRIAERHVYNRGYDAGYRVGWHVGNRSDTDYTGRVNAFLVGVILTLGTVIVALQVAVSS